MSKETIVSSRPDRELRKKIITPGDYTIVPYEDSRCKIKITNLSYTTVKENGMIEIMKESRVFGTPFDGNIIIGDMDCFIDKDIELILQQMCLGEICAVRLTYKNSEDVVFVDISCNIELLDVTEEQLVSDWSWARLYESATHHKERGVQLVKDKRILDAFRRFNKALKMLIAIEPIDPMVIDERKVKEMIDVKVKLYNNMAHCQLQFSEYGAALVLCSKALQFDSENLKALYRRCIAYIGLNMYEEAWSDIQHALAIDPNDKASQLKANELKPKIEKMNKEYTTVIKNMFK